ncbi:MAG: polysaccharide deacetylase family protein [Bacteroidales bacterium]
MILASVPSIVTRLFPSYIWRFNEPEKRVYLTFDDGPIPETTNWILSVLKEYGAKATFFCVGDNVRKYPYLYEDIIKNGHSVGNHTYNHLNGRKTETKEYVKNVRKAEHFIQSNLFRPPHGMIKSAQYQDLKEDYNIVMWNVLSLDYERRISPQQCLRNVTSNASPGSIIVFHDSVKSWKNLQFALPMTLEFLSRQGYSFPAIQLESNYIQKTELIKWGFGSSMAVKRI